MAHSFNRFIMKKLRYLPKRKLDIFGIGSAISTAGSVASSIYAANKQAEVTRETNEMNKQLAQETNALDYQIFTEANEFNRIEAEKQRAHAESLQVRSERYNSLENQVAQARRAGISPAAVAGGTQTSVGVGSPGAAAQSASVPTSTAPHMQTPDLSALQGISSAFGNFSQAMLNSEQAKKIKAETSAQLTLNKWIDKEKEAGLKRTRSESARNFAMAKLTNVQIDETKEKINEIKADVRLIDEKIFAQNIENAFKSKQMEYLTKKMKDEYKITHLQAKKLAATLAYEISDVQLKPALTFSQIGLNKNQAAMFDALVKLYGTNDAQARLDLEIDRDVKELLKGADFVGKLFKIVSYFIKK